MKYNIPTDYGKLHIINKDSKIKIELRWNSSGVAGMV